MKRHRLDSVSLVLGLLAGAAGAAALWGRLGELINHPTQALPLGIGLVGVALIASARQRAPEEAEPEAAPVSD